MTKARKPAWVDKNAQKLKVSIDDVSRLRKLKKTEDEAVIGGSEYATRLKEHFVKMQGEHAMFDWAKPKEERSRKIFEDKSEVQHKPKKLLQDSGSDDDESDDPIGDLLKSNTAIYSKSTEMLKSGTLKYSKLRNANAAS